MAFSRGQNGSNASCSLIVAPDGCMSEPSTTREEDSWFTQPVKVLTQVVVRWPRATLAVGLTLGLLSLGWMFFRLELKTSRLDLLNPESSFNQRWMGYLEEFGAEDDAIILVEGANEEQVLAAMDDLVAELQKHPDYYHSIFYRADLSIAKNHALYYLPQDELAALNSGLEQLQPILSGDWTLLSVENQLGYAVQGTLSPDQAQREAAQDQLSLHLQNLNAALLDQNQYHSPWSEWEALEDLRDRFTAHYAVVKQGQMGIVLLRLVDDGKSFDRGSEAITHLRSLLAEFQQTQDGIQLGLTGLPIMENDEMKSNETASVKSSIISLMGVAGLFIAGFGGVRHPLLAVAALMVGITWACGYLTLAIGHLNILSMAFGVILIGLGIDFGIHYLARYLTLRAQEEDSAKALIKTSTSVGPGIITGGITTAIAFMAAALTEFTGVAELGVIAGGGIFLCVIAAVTMLPAMIQWMDHNSGIRKLPRPLAAAPTVWFSEHAPKLTIAISILILLLCTSGIPNVWYDHNLLNLQAEGLESVHLEERLLAETDQSVWFAISITDDPAELLARKAKFEQLSTVERTEEIVSFLPKNPADKQDEVAAIHRQLLRLPLEPPLLQVAPAPQFLSVLEQLHNQLMQAGQNGAAESIRSLAKNIDDLPAATATFRISRYQQQLAADLLARCRLIQSMSTPRPPVLDDLPLAVRNRFVGRTGKHKLKVYSNGDIWDMDELARFVEDVREVDPEITGQPVQTYEASPQMQMSYVHAALYALIGVLMVLVIDFHSLRLALLTLIPVGFGMLQLFGLMGLLNIPLNPANMIVLPLILGIGLDDGVHVMHEYRCQRGGYKLSRWTATAIVLTSLTTMVGFGSLMLADHRGLQSLGRVLTLGVSCCLFTSLVPLPALLTLMARHRDAKSAESEKATSKSLADNLSECPREEDVTTADQHSR